MPEANPMPESEEASFLWFNVKAFLCFFFVPFKQPWIPLSSQNRNHRPNQGSPRTTAIRHTKVRRKQMFIKDQIRFLTIAIHTPQLVERGSGVNNLRFQSLWPGLKLEFFLHRGSVHLRASCDSRFASLLWSTMGTLLIATFLIGQVGSKLREGLLVTACLVPRRSIAGSKLLLGELLR